MKTGKQLTEAMLLKGKSRQKACRATFNKYLSLIEEGMISSVATGNAMNAQKIKQMCKDFDKFEIKHTQLEQSYNGALNNAKESLIEIDHLLESIEYKTVKNAGGIVENIIDLAEGTVNEYVVGGNKVAKLKETICDLQKELPIAVKTKNYDQLVPFLTSIKEILEDGISKEAPNFFTMGYYLTFANQPLPVLRP